MQHVKELDDLNLSVLHWLENRLGALPLTMVQDTMMSNPIHFESNSSDYFFTSIQVSVDQAGVRVYWLLAFLHFLSQNAIHKGNDSCAQLGKK